VNEVNTMVMKGKPAGGRMMRRKTSWKSDWKKAKRSKMRCASPSPCGV